MPPGLALPIPDATAPKVPGLEPDPSKIVPMPAAPAAPVPKFASSLKLNEAQEREFLRECILRINELRREMGLTTTNDVIAGSWMWRRQVNEAFYQGDLTWRLAFGGIFLKSNITLGSGLRHVRYNSARVQDDLLGTTPFMAALGRNPRKEETAKQIENYVQGEIEKANVRAQLREAQKVALYRNECVVKTGYISDSTPYVGEATVLVDAMSGEPILTPEKGLYIYEDDDVIEHPEVAGLMMLESDPSFTMAPHAEPGLVVIPANGEVPERIGRYEYFPELPQIITHREGVYADALDYRSFLCPLKVKTIQEADTVVHLYLETPNRLQTIYGGIDVSQNYFSYWANPGQHKPKHEQGERDEPETAIHQQVIVAEVYRRCDPDKSGQDKEVLAVLDLTNERMIYRNYLANHMSKRPFDAVPGIERVPGRWYGRGIYGMLDSHLFYEDVEASRSFFKNSQDATIQFAYRDAVDEWRNGQPVQIGTGDTYWVNMNWDMEGKRKPIWRENLSENFEPDLVLMNTMRQSADSLIGSISTQSANQSNFDQSKTATGNQLVQQASDVIVKATEQDQTEAINAILANVVEIILEHMDRKVLAFDPQTGLLATINRNEARNIQRDVRLLLTRSKSTQLLNTSTQALDIVDKHYAMMDANLRYAKLRRPLVLTQLKGLEVQDANTLVPEISEEQVAQWEEMRAQKVAPEKPPSENISVRLPDLVGQERVQALARFDIEADMAAYEAQQAKEEEAARAKAEAMAKGGSEKAEGGSDGPKIPNLD